jgi:hypothetical protein
MDRSNRNALGPNFQNLGFSSTFMASNRLVLDVVSSGVGCIPTLKSKILLLNSCC